MFSHAADFANAELAALAACTALLQGNWPKGEVADVAVIPGLAVDNWQDNPVDDGILVTAAELAGTGRVKRILIPGYVASRPEGRYGPASVTGYPGGGAWKAALHTLDVGDWIICYCLDEVGPDGTSWNTRTEALDFLRMAQERRWKRAIVVATPFHVLRVMMTLVKGMADIGYELRCDPVTPRAVSWTRSVYHSQGVACVPRYEHVGRECARLPRYQANDTICTFQELHAYLLRRLTA